LFVLILHRAGAGIMHCIMNSLTFPVLRLLADGKFQSGEALARHFGVTRATVWNALQDAEQMGIRLFSVRGKGYRLPEPVDFIETQRVFEGLEPYADRFKLEVHDRLDSTNTYLMKQSASGASHATCVVTELQTQGRGRRGRVWQAGLGSSLTFSVLWRFECGAGGLSGLSLAVGIALMRALQELGIQGAGLKWPNDILHTQRKLAGILIELQGDMDGPSAAVIGIGLNWRLPEQVVQLIDQAVTDVQALSLASSDKPLPLDKSVGLGVLLRHLTEVLDIFTDSGFESLRDEWMAYHAYTQQPVRMLMPDGREIEGMASGVAADGALLVETRHGLQRFASGEVSLRGVS
jgi:BirA family biotin operon repressor/biotin-[acetyl-CoA-carboxylase] ligase